MTKDLWTFEAFFKATGGEFRGTAPSHITDISIDSRTISNGAAFFAIQGVAQDGHKYVDNALADGAGLAVISQQRADQFCAHSGPFIIVDEPMDAMRSVALAARARSQGDIIAVTGSVGKTSTKDMLRTIYLALGSVHAAPASFNNHWGVPLTLGRLPAQTQTGVFEIGMNHKGEITPLAQMVRPEIAIITTVGAVHLGAFDNVGEIALAKAEIFDGLNPGGIALLPADNEFLSILQDAAQAKQARILTFGQADHATIRLMSNKSNQDGGQDIIAAIEGQKVPYSLSAPGLHMAINSLAVLGTLHVLDQINTASLAAFNTFEPGAGRGERHELKFADGRSVTLLDESYNANPLSIAATLNLMAQMAGPRRRIAVLGDMLELGTQSRNLHEGLSNPIDEQGVNGVFLVGPEIESLSLQLQGSRHVHHCQTSKDIIQPLCDFIEDGDVILVKGSLGMKMKTVIEALKTLSVDSPKG